MHRTCATRWERRMDLGLANARVVVTGGASNIGRGIVHQFAIGPMKDAGSGSIVFIASDAAFGQIRQGIYGASKAAMVALARTTAREHGRHGIRSNVVCPGLVIPDGPDAIGESSLWAVGEDEV